MTIIYKERPLIKITINENIDGVKDRFTITKDLFDNISTEKQQLLVEMLNNNEDFAIMNDFGMCRKCHLDNYEMDDKSVTVCFHQYGICNVKIKGKK